MCIAHLHGALQRACSSIHAPRAVASLPASRDESLTSVALKVACVDSGCFQYPPAQDALDTHISPTAPTQNQKESKRTQWVGCTNIYNRQASSARHKQASKLSEVKVTPGWWQALVILLSGTKFCLLAIFATRMSRSMKDTVYLCTCIHNKEYFHTKKKRSSQKLWSAILKRAITCWLLRSGCWMHNSHKHLQAAIGFLQCGQIQSNLCVWTKFQCLKNITHPANYSALFWFICTHKGAVVMYSLMMTFHVVGSEADCCH